MGEMEAAVGGMGVVGVWFGLERGGVGWDCVRVLLDGI